MYLLKSFNFLKSISLIFSTNRIIFFFESKHMNNTIERFEKIKSNIKSLNYSHKLNIVAVSKTFNLEHIMPLVNYGHLHFGENKVQEASAKWTELKK